MGGPTRQSLRGAAILAFANGLSLGATMPARAADANLETRMGDGPTYDTAIFWGAEASFGRSNRMIYGVNAGFVTAINGDLGTSGWTISGNVGGSRSKAPLSRTNSLHAALLAGYQWQMPGMYFSVAGGPHYVSNHDTPRGGPTDGDEFGAMVQYSFETTGSNSLYFQSYGSYSTVFDRKYFQAKAGYKAEAVKFGPEFSVFDEKASRPTLRYGGFVSGIQLTDTLSMTASAGYQQDLDRQDPDGFYAQIGFSLPLDLR